MNHPPELEDIRQAARRIAPHLHRTPVMTCRGLDELCGARLFFKCENLQKAGAFKARGAHNAVFLLSQEQAARGVATHSSGNHAAALALAASRRGIPAHIVMPRDAPKAKQAAVAGYGGRIRLCEPTLAAREETLQQVLAETGAELVHPYDDYRVIAGQGTAALELLEQVPELDMVLAPVGGGGLLSGTAIAVKGLAPGCRVVGCEPAAADDAYRSLQAGSIQDQPPPRTVADGLKTMLSQRTFAIIQEKVDGIVTVSEQGIVSAMRLIWERMKLVVEPSGAVPLAVLLEGGLPVRGQRVGIIISGGNLDLDRLPWQT